jgi:nitrous oxide reductase accessory protein NosL
MNDSMKRLPAPSLFPVKFVTEFGGKVLRFAEVKPDMADLSGGAQHDARM